MNIGYVSILLLIFALALLFWGAYGVSKYAFRISSGKGMATLLFPPYTFYFSFYELEEEGKETPIFLWMWGLVVTLVVVSVFWQPLSYVVQGRAAELSQPSGVEAAVAEYKDQSGAVVADEKAEPEDKPEPEENVAGTNNAATNNAGTNNSATNGTNNSDTNGTDGNAAATNGAAEAPAEAAGTEAATP